MGMVALAVMALAVGGFLYWRHSRRFESTDDAYVDVTFIHVSPQVPGRVLRVLVRDNEDVRAGQVLVELDPAEYRSRRDQAEANVAQACGRLEQADAQVLVAEAQYAQARAALEVAEANAGRARRDFERYRELRRVNAGAVSPQLLDEARAAAEVGAAQVAASGKAAAAAESQISTSRAQVSVNRALLEGAAAELRQAELNVSYTSLTASLPGRISQKTVAPGDFVQAGTDLMALVPREVYVTANFKETQLTRMHSGQRAEVRVDAYPSLRLAGWVDSIQAGTGQAFSVLPAQNATGNWVKVVQRVPVKVVLERLPDEPRRLGPGMSAEVTVWVR